MGTSIENTIHRSESEESEEDPDISSAASDHGSLSQHSALRPTASQVLRQSPTPNRSQPASPSPSYSSDATISEHPPTQTQTHATPTPQPKTRRKLTPKRLGTYRGFHIVRLIPLTTKSGLQAPEPLSLSSGSFGVTYGDFLLDMSGPRTTQRVHVRNLQGQDAYLPRRMLQDVYHAWGVSPTLEVSSSTGENGDGNMVGLPLRKLSREIEGEGGNIGFGLGEIVMRIRKEEVEGKVLVCDFERNAGLVERQDVEDVEDMPWGLLVEQGVLDGIWNEKKGPQLRMKMGRKRKVGYSGGGEGDEGGEGDDKRKGEGETANGKSESSSKKKKKKITVKEKKKRIPGTVFVLKTF